MFIKWRITLGLLAGTAIFAANPVGSVSSTGPVEISGTNLSAATVSSWPLVAGDVVATGNAPAVVFIAGKGRVTLDANSRVRVEKVGEQLSVKLMGGGLSYDLAAGSDLLFFNGSRGIAPAAQSAALPSQGSVTAVESVRAPAPVKFGSTAQLVTRPRPSISGP